FHLKIHGPRRHAPNIPVLATDDVEGKRHARPESPFAGDRVLLIDDVDNGGVINGTLDVGGQRPNVANNATELDVLIGIGGDRKERLQAFVDLVDVALGDLGMDLDGLQAAGEYKERARLRTDQLPFLNLAFEHEELATRTAFDGLGNLDTRQL